ncbi:hypothetical protein Fleli_0342 [Bernardetia litoralis DSM 6794]|uniref:6-phosphogluconate dehydrogenase n=1 Tax=Bernardetia litoralis (strain ATCC 23117 / DSM 6794 / NBRC 15988 / NCIMB 1366 / Fx l1 / Sio-4) TaxID=880071 RepID=I4AFT8_BERLS|nr:hypothetical protein [Bernardetia litoralis]AFM02823.1 hypothetical protein Fleli_0342 [Bernardetia litoralis DSM 6794]
MAISKVKVISLSTVAVILLLFIGVGSFYYLGSFSTGDRAGVVIKVSQRGYIFKTWEGEMNLNDQGNTIEKFEFSVENDQTKVIEDLKDAALTGERIRISYVERYRTFSWRGDTKYFITEVVRQKGNNPENNELENTLDENIEENEKQNDNSNQEPVSTDTTLHDM